MSEPSTCNPLEEAVALTEQEKKRAKTLFDKRAGEAKVVDVGKFKLLIKSLVEKWNKAKVEGGGKADPLPKEADLEEAFTRADVDESGTVDWPEFLVLLQDVKAGRVKA